MQKLVQYVLSGREPNDPVDTHDCSEQSVAEDLGMIAQMHNGKGAVNAIHLIQSWSGEESKSLAPTEFNALGRELVEKKFPGHAFLVVTHTETDKVHNHIVVSPWHTETGKKIENKKYHLYELREINDTICKSRGLSVIDHAGKDRQARLPEKVQKMAQYNGRSWLLDLVQKADFARAYATSYDEYSSILFEFGVTARVEEKNITYFYGSRNRGKRGSKIGPKYDKKGLEATFQANDKLFASIPGLRSEVRSIVAAVAAEKVDHKNAEHALLSISATTYSQGKKDYTHFTKAARAGRIERFPHEIDVSQSLIPISEIRRARNTSILSYCRTNNIELSKNSEGKPVLKGREFVEVNEFDWINKRNRTKGSLIEFVAAHKNLTYLQAIADINGNKRLLLLEQHLGPTQRSYTSFYIPKEKQLRELDAKVRIATMLTNYGADAHHAPVLFKSGQAQVDQSGTIRLFAKEDDSGAFELSEKGTNNWRKTKVGTFQKAFFSLSTGNRKLALYVDPFSFLKHQGKHALWATRYQHDVLCLMEPDERILDHYLAENRHIKEIHVTPGGVGSGTHELDFFNNLKKRAAPFGVEVKHGQGQEKSKDRGIEMPSL